MMAGSKCRHLNKGGLGLHTKASYQGRASPLPDLQHFLANRMHGFVSLDRPVGSPEAAESLARSHAPFDGAVILLQDVFQVLHRAQPTTLTERAFGHQLLDHSWITRIPVDVH